MRQGSPRRVRHRAIAALASVALIAAACGGDDDDDAEPATEEPADEPADEPAEEPADEPAEEPADEPADEPAEEPAEEPADEPAEDPTAAEADDSIHGNGAERLESVINNPPGPADESLDPVVITMANLEGDALGSFPEIREGLEIAVADINANWGGIGGRPIELDVCVHGFDPNAAINCGNEIAEAQPNLNINGIEFFTPALWPTFLGANIPTIQTVPIFVADFTVEGNGISPYGGCPVAFPGGASYTMEIRQFSKVAVVYANTPPGLECYADTEERFWDYLIANEAEGAEYIGIPDNAGDPSDDDALVQQIAAFFGDTPGEETAVFFGTQASDCNALLSGVDAAGIDTTVVMSGSCIDDSVKANPAAADAEFSWQARISERPDLYEGWVRTEIEWREALLESSDLRTTPVSAFLRVGHSAGVFAWSVLSEMVENGEDIDDADAVIAAFAGLENQHLLAAPPVSCTTNTEEFPSVCTKDITFVRWTGTDWDLEGSVLGGEFFSVADIQARVAAGNPRVAAEG